MSRLDSLPLDPSGFLDMDQLAPDGSELSDAEVEGIRSALQDDPVDEPEAEEWSGLVDGVLAEADAEVDADGGGPFAVDADGAGPAGVRAGDGAGRGDGPEIVDRTAGDEGDDEPAADVDAPTGEEAPAPEPAPTDDDPGAEDGLGVHLEGGLGGGDLLEQGSDLLESAGIGELDLDLGPAGVDPLDCDPLDAGPELGDDVGDLS